MSYVIIDSNELELRSEHVLGQDDIEILMSYEKIFIKFLLKSKLSYQIELAKGTFRGKEEHLYRSMETIDELTKSLHNIPDTVKNYLQNMKK